MNPTTAPVVEITLAGEARTLKYGFLAYRELKLNPFDPASVAEFQSRGLDVELAAQMIRAGLLHEYYGRNAERKGQQPPTLDDVIAELDMFSFVAIYGQIQKAIGTDEDEKPKGETENPPNA